MFKPASEIKVECLGVGDPSLDQYVRFCRGNVYTIYGPPGTGKTNYALALCVNVVERGGTCLWIATEPFPRTRLDEIAKRRQIDPTKVQVAVVDSVKELFDAIRYAAKIKHDVLVIDTIIAPFRTSKEYQGLGNLAKRQQALASAVELVKQAVVKNNAVGVLITHYIEAPGVERHAGGHVLAHLTLMYKVIKKGDIRYIITYKLPDVPEQTIPFRLCEYGVCAYH